MVFFKPSFSLTKLLVAASICFASLVSVPAPAAAACQPGEAGCVLPVGEAAPLSVTQPTTTTAPVYEEEGGGTSWLPIAIGILVAGALLWFLVLDDDDDPESP